MTFKTILMTEQSLKEHLQAFRDVEESIENLEQEELKKNPKSKYLKLIQQKLPFLE